MKPSDGRDSLPDRTRYANVAMSALVVVFSYVHVTREVLPPTPFYIVMFLTLDWDSSMLAATGVAVLSGGLALTFGVLSGVVSGHYRVTLRIFFLGAVGWSAIIATGYWKSIGSHDWWDFPVLLVLQLGVPLIVALLEVLPMKSTTSRINHAIGWQLAVAWLLYGFCPVHLRF